MLYTKKRVPCSKLSHPHRERDKPIVVQQKKHIAYTVCVLNLNVPLKSSIFFHIDFVSLEQTTFPIYTSLESDHEVQFSYFKYELEPCFIISRVYEMIFQACPDIASGHSGVH